MGGPGKLLVIGNLQSSRTEHTPFHPYRDDRQCDVRRTRVGRNSRRAASVGACEAWQTFMSSTCSVDHSRISQPNIAAPNCCWLRVYNAERKSSACGYQRHWGIVRIVSPIVYFKKARVEQQQLIVNQPKHGPVQITAHSGNLVSAHTVITFLRMARR